MRETDNLTTFTYRMSWKSGSLNLLEPSGPHRAYYGTALPFMEKCVTLVAEIAEYPICLGENLRYANSVHPFVSRVNELFKVRTADSYSFICPTVPDRSGSSHSDALEVQPTALFRREHAQGCVWTDLYWD